MAEAAGKPGADRIHAGLGWALLIGAAIGLVLALLLVLCRKGGLKQNRAVHAVVNVYVNIVRSMPFIITLVFVFPLTRLIVGKTYGSTAMLVPLVISSCSRSRMNTKARSRSW